MVALHKIVVASVWLLIVGFLVGPEVAQGQTPFQMTFCTQGSLNCDSQGTPSSSFVVPNGSVLLIEFVSAACASSDPSTLMVSLVVRTRLAGPPNVLHRFLPHLVGPARQGSGDLYTVSQNTRLYAGETQRVSFTTRQTGNGTVQCLGSVSGQTVP